MPFNFADVLILRYLIGTVDAQQTVVDLNAAIGGRVIAFLQQGYKIKEVYDLDKEKWK